MEIAVGFSLRPIFSMNLGKFLYLLRFLNLNEDRFGQKLNKTTAPFGGTPNRSSEVAFHLSRFFQTFVKQAGYVQHP